MTTVWEIVLPIIALMVLLRWPHHRASHLIVLAALLLTLLAGCARSATSLPEPPPLPTPILCAAPAGMTAPEAVPLAPQGDYTQRDVALYVQALHRWGSRGWLSLNRVREHAERCAESADTDNE